MSTDRETDRSGKAQLVVFFRPLRIAQAKATYVVLGKRKGRKGKRGGGKGCYSVYDLSPPFFHG